MHLQFPGWSGPDFPASLLADMQGQTVPMRTVLERVVVQWRLGEADFGEMSGRSPGKSRREARIAVAPILQVRKKRRSVVVDNPITHIDLAAYISIALVDRGGVVAGLAAIANTAAKGQRVGVCRSAGESHQRGKPHISPSPVLIQVSDERSAFLLTWTSGRAQTERS